MQVIDQTAGTTRQGYELVRTYQLTDLSNALVRVRITRDTYEHQSSAVAEVLTPGLTWTELAREYPQHWYPATPSPLARNLEHTEVLGPVADGLVERASIILAATRRQ